MEILNWKYNKMNILSWCKCCDQGWVRIVKDTQNGKLYCECDELFTLWASPEDYENGVYEKKNRLSGRSLVLASEEEIIAAGWDKPINKVATCNLCFSKTRPNDKYPMPILREHGWVTIKKNTDNGELFCKCDNCGTVWLDICDVLVKSGKPSDITVENSTEATRDEIIAAGWDKYDDVYHMRNNMIPDLHKLVTWHFGQNYPFNGCMAFIMEKLGRPDLADYWFFAGITGDNFTFVYGKNNRYNDCISVVCGGRDFIDTVFDKIGYDYTFVSRDELNAEKYMYIQMAKRSIMNGIPVLIHGTQDTNDNYQVICGYDEDTLLFLDGDVVEPFKLDTANDIDFDFIFIGDKIRDIDIAKLYRDAVLNIPKWLTMDKNDIAVTFGAQGFRDWADDIENGRYDNLTAETFEEWKHYTVYVCNLATNSGCGRSFLEKAYELHPDLAFIPEVIELYRHAGGNQPGQLWHALEEAGGGFNIKIDTLHDKEKRKVIADIIREFAVDIDKVCELIRYET